MTGIAKVGIDAAGGMIVGNLAPTVFVEGNPVAVQGAEVEPHGRHRNQVMEGASENVFANGIPVCRAGDSASCGHAASGSGTVIAN